MFEILPQSAGANIAVKASGMISQSDYEAFAPELNRWLDEVLRFRLLLDWEHLEGWDEEALATRFGERFMRRLRCERLAILSDDPRRSDDIEALRGLLMSKEIRVFPPAERDAAWSWLVGDSV